MISVSIRYKNLTEIITCNNIHNLFYPISIQLIKDIIQKQQRDHLIASPLKKIELRQFKCYRKCLVLPLRPLAFNCITTNSHFQIVTVDTMQGISDCQILKSVTLYDIKQWTALAMRYVIQDDPLLIL